MGSFFFFFGGGLPVCFGGCQLRGGGRACGQVILEKSRSEDAEALGNRSQEMMVQIEVWGV